MAQRRHHASFTIFGRSIDRKSAVVLCVCTGLIILLSVVYNGILAVPTAVQLDKKLEAPQQNSRENQSKKNSSQIKSDTSISPKRFLVDVSGAVAKPGVYKLGTDDARVTDAIEAAGGLSDDADRTRINLAQKLNDGEKVYVPRIGEDTGIDSQLTSKLPAESSLDTSHRGLVNINTADETTLQTLSGVGEATAKAIIKERETNGAFESPEDLMRVSGIGEKKFAKLKDDICV